MPERQVVQGEVDEEFSFHLHAERLEAIPCRAAMCCLEALSAIGGGFAGSSAADGMGPDDTDF
jgi:hypothetical protein